MLLAEEASPKLYCPLCKRVFSDPYITTCGVSPVDCHDLFHALLSIQ